MSRAWTTTAVVALLVVLGGTLTAASADTGDNTIRACENKITGVLRIPAAGQSCLTKPALLAETPITWSQQGPAGASGPAGATGPTGAPGSPGPASEQIIAVYPRGGELLFNGDDAPTGNIDVEVQGSEPTAPFPGKLAADGVQPGQYLVEWTAQFTANQAALGSTDISCSLIDRTGPNSNGLIENAGFTTKAGDFASTVILLRNVVDLAVASDIQVVCSTGALTGGGILTLADGVLTITPEA